MAIEAGSRVRAADRNRWRTWGWLSRDGQITRVLIDPDRVYTVTVAAGRFKRADGTWQPVTKMICPVAGIEVMAERDAIVEDM
jgi:hypothetical protein